MANSVSASFPEIWSRMMQRKHQNQAVYSAIVSREGMADLKKGDTWHKPYRSSLVVQDYTRGSAITATDLTDTDESLSVDQEKVVSFYVDDFDSLQHNYRLMDEYSSDAVVDLNNEIDGKVLGEYANATSSIDDSDITGGTASVPFSLTTSNVLQAFSKARQKLQEQNSRLDNLFAVVSPQYFQVLEEYLMGRESSLGDSTGLNGHQGKFAGFKLFVSNQLGWSGRCNIATKPTDGDTVVIGGVTFTFKTTLGSTAGNVLIGATAATANTNLAALINTPGTTTTEGVALSSANQEIMRLFTATAAATSTTVTALGKSYVAVSETFNDATDTWDREAQHQLFGRAGAIDFVGQQMPKTQVKSVSDKLGSNIHTSALYGVKTFTESAKELVDVLVDSSGF